MDVRMPVLDGIEATRRLVADSSLADMKVLVLTTFEVDKYVFEALRAGASGFLSRTSNRMTSGRPSVSSPTARRSCRRA